MGILGEEIKGAKGGRTGGSCWGKVQCKPNIRNWRGVCVREWRVIALIASINDKDEGKVIRVKAITSTSFTSDSNAISR